MPKTAEIGLRIGLIISIAFILLSITLASLETIPVMAAGGTRATLTVYPIKRTAITRTLTASDLDGHKFQNDGYTFIEAYNALGTVVTLTFVTPSTSTADLTVSIPATTTKLVGPFPPQVFNQRAGAGTDKGKVYIDYAGVTTGTTSSLTIGAFRLTLN